MLGLLLSALWAVAMVLPAWLAFTYIERPGRTLLRRLLTRRTAKVNAIGEASPLSAE